MIFQVQISKQTETGIVIFTVEIEADNEEHAATLAIVAIKSPAILVEIERKK